MPLAEAIPDERRATTRPTDSLSAARHAFRASRTEESQFDAAKRFSAQYLRRLSAVLPLDEISVILAAEQYREQGLALSRSGDNETAATLLSQAAATCEQARLSHHAIIAALSFQLAAEAYIKHRRGDYAGAVGDLENAILVAAELEVTYGHDMEFRRVHLARNILRVRASVPLDAEVVADSIALLCYIGGDAMRWPIAAGRAIGNPANMADSQRAWAIDELLVNLLLPTVDLDRNAELLPMPEDWVGADCDFLAAIHWCHAMSHLRRDTRHRFLDHATSFFETGSGRLVHAGRHLERQLEELGFALD